jgi:hypothetical protein
MEAPYNPPLERQVTGTGCTCPPLPSSPIRAGWAETHYPLHRTYPSPEETTHLGPASPASKSGSEVTLLTQDDRKEHFWLNGTSLLGQTAEIETRAG